mmetsp:Transcript_21402/g.33265  ORF Transcript_21402/g.33265 Transcript_21402/m.33265 type:complete len:131 (-) Transcript_21402:41-433(-)
MERYSWQMYDYEALLYALTDVQANLGVGSEFSMGNRPIHDLFLVYREDVIEWGTVAHQFPTPDSVVRMAKLAMLACNVIHESDTPRRPNQVPKKMWCYLNNARNDERVQVTVLAIRRMFSEPTVGSPRDE